MSESPPETTRSRTITEDAISNGALTIRQHENGFRFGLDALLLATDLPDLPDSPAITDLGAGQGTVGLCIANRKPSAEVLAVERRKSLYDLLEQNIEVNRLEDNVNSLRGDIRNHQEQLTPHAADLVVCNPPYYREGARRPSENEERADARHERHGVLADFIDAAVYHLDQRGFLKLNLPPRRLPELNRIVSNHDLSYDWMRFFHSRESEPAYLTEITLRRGGASDLVIRPPLYIYRNETDYTDEVTRRIETAGSPES